MADKDGNIIAKDYGIGIKPPTQHFHVKGHENAGWGMKARLSQIFAADGRTIMLAFDHGYIMGSTAGLERLDLVIPPLMDHADCLMATRGALRTCIPADNRKAIALRCSADSSVLKDDMSMGVIGTDIEEALRMNASCMAVQCFIGSASEIASLHNLSYYINKGERYGIPVLGVVAVGKEMERTTRYFALATRLLAEQEHISSRPITVKILSRSLLPVRSQSSLPVVKKFRNRKLWIWLTVLLMKAQPVLIWGAMFCRQNVRVLCCRRFVWLCTKMSNLKLRIRLIKH